MKLLYSINSWLAYKIAEMYYNNVHYVWCAPFFNANGQNPPSSDPSELHRTLAKEVLGQDKHGPKISQNKTGILKGADIKLHQGIINDFQHKEILEIVNSSDYLDFRPLIYIIPFNLVSNIIQPASIQIKANYFSKEFIIENLAIEHFDVVDILTIKDHV